MKKTTALISYAIFALATLAYANPVPIPRSPFPA